MGWMRRIWLVLVLGCGGGSGGVGVDGDKRLVQLDDAEYANVCAYVIANFPRRVVMCPEGEISVGTDDTQEECVADFQMTRTSIPECPVTVAQYVACVDAQAARTDEERCDPITGDNPPEECLPFFDSACGFD
jgi:hypothetical protein